MKTAIQLDLTFEQLLTMVKNLPKAEKIRLTKELEKEIIDSKLSKLLKSFRTKELSANIINGEVEIVRQQIHEKKKH